MTATITASLPAFVIGLTQLLIGIYMSLTSDKDSYSSVFKVLLIIASIGSLAIILRSWIILK